MQTTMFIQPRNIAPPNTKSLVWVSKCRGIQPELLHTQRHPKLSSRGQEFSWKKYQNLDIN